MIRLFEANNVLNNVNGVCFSAEKFGHITGKL